MASQNEITEKSAPKSKNSNTNVIIHIIHVLYSLENLNDQN